MCDDSRMSEISESDFCLSAPTSSLAATPAKKTVTPDKPQTQSARLSAVSSSQLLMSFARDLFFARIRPSLDQTPLGLGGDFDPSWNDLVTLCCPSNSGPVALAL